MSSATHAFAEGRGCAPHHHASSQGHYVRAESPGANSITRTPGNRDATLPVQCWAERADDFRRSPFFVSRSGLHLQFHLFEYEMSREFVRGKTWGHEPRPNPYSALFPFFSMIKQVWPAHLLGHNQRHGQRCLTSSAESIEVLVSLKSHN